MHDRGIAATPALVSLNAAAETLGVNPRTLRRRIADGSLPAYRVGRLVKVKPEDLQALVRPIPTVRTA